MSMMPDLAASQLVTDLTSSAGDFCPRGPRSAIMFGVREVLVLSPAGEDTLGNDTRAKMVQGAVNIALSNTNCSLPFLIQVMNCKDELFNGSWVADNARAEMSSVCLNRKPSHCNYLSGLLELYRNKVRMFTVSSSHNFH